MVGLKCAQNCQRGRAPGRRSGHWAKISKRLVPTGKHRVMAPRYGLGAAKLTLWNTGVADRTLYKAPCTPPPALAIPSTKVAKISPRRQQIFMSTPRTGAPTASPLASTTRCIIAISRALKMCEHGHLTRSNMWSSIWRLSQPSIAPLRAPKWK